MLWYSGQTHVFGLYLQMSHASCLSCTLISHIPACSLRNLVHTQFPTPAALSCHSSFTSPPLYPFSGSQRRVPRILDYLPYHYCELQQDPDHLPDICSCPIWHPHMPQSLILYLLKLGLRLIMD